MRVINIYFSPTGGTKKVSDILAKVTNGEIFDFDITLPTSKVTFSFLPSDFVIISLPCYGGRVPKVALDRIKNLQGNGARCLIVCVYGNRAFDDALLEMFNTLKELNFSIVAAISAIAKHSIATEYASNRPDEEDKIILTNFVKKVINKETILTSVVGNYPYKELKSFGLVPKATKECKGCAQCATLCPVGAINKDTLIADPKKCISCMRCVSICPNNARKINPLIKKGVSLALRKSCSIRKEVKLYE